MDTPGHGFVGACDSGRGILSGELLAIAQDEKQDGLLRVSCPEALRGVSVKDKVLKSK